MAKTLANVVDHVRNILDQITANAQAFSEMAAAKRRESYINGRLKELETIYTEAKSQHVRIISAKEEGNIKEKYFADEIYIKIKEAYFEYYGDLHEALMEGTKGAGNTSVTQDKGIDIKLRRIELPPFSGGYDQWRPFYELYMSLIHNNDSLADIQKLHYLKASVQGEAARLLQHVSLEEKNYESAWSILIDRYENKRVLVNTHLRVLLNQKPIITENATGIKGILDTTTECLHSLRNLGVPVDSWDTILVHILSSKLPVHTQELWEGELQGAKSLVEFTKFSKFLETRFRTLEAIEQSQNENRKFNKPSFTVANKPFFNKAKTFHTSIAGGLPVNRQQPSITCRLCRANHSLRQCEQFIKMDVNTRINTVKKIAACSNCLSCQHQTKECTSRYRCQHCNKNHHTMLHLSRKSSQHNNSSGNHQLLVNHHQAQTNAQDCPQDAPQPQTNTVPVVNAQDQTPSSVKALFTQKLQPTKVLLATALVQCHASNGEKVTLRALIDPGSEATFITEAAVQRLRLPKRKTATNIISLGQLTTGIAHGQVTLTISSTYNNKFSLTLETFVYANITSILPSETFEVNHWEHLNNLNLADPVFNVPGKIDLLLGADAYSAIILPGLIKGIPGSPIAQQTELGWIISGQISESIKKTIHTYHQLIDLDAQLRRFWEIEEIPEHRKPTEEEKMCEDHYVRTHKRLKNGQYQVSLPFKDNAKPKFEGSRQTALSRLFQLENRFRVNPKLKEMYTECLNDYITSSHMIEIQPHNSENAYYLPHHAVFKESSTTKLRVVFDASCKTKSGQSLNDSLMIGPTLQNELSHVIMKWRKFKVAFTADITKMYRQIWINPEDSVYQLICWRDQINGIIKTYALKTVTFGTAPAPFLAVRTLQQLAADEQANFPLASEILKNNFYVDDVLYGADSIQEAEVAQKQLINITNSAGFPLKKWASNEEAILQHLQPDEREINIPLSFGKEDFVKTLGFQWYPGPDIFKFNFKLPKIADLTKRSILSDISRLFDPHGWISPCIVYAKLIMQELWLRQSGWDDPIPDELKLRWLRYRSELTSLENIEIPRWIHITSNSEKVQIHGFCDASEKAYAAVIYVRIPCVEAIHVQLLAAKTKIAPLKRISLPRLELCAATLLARLLNSVKTAMDLQNTETFAWTDSMITLSWIKAHPSKWKSFVANRVTEIQSLTSTSIWNHINTKNNPADIASRGLFPSEIQNATLWWQGPSMLKTFTPILPKIINIDTDLEIRRVQSMHIGTSDEITTEIIKKYSSLTKAIRVFAYLLRAINNFKHPRNRTKNHLTVAETKKGLLQIIKSTQNASYKEEKNSLIHKSKLSNRSSLLMLHPFLDQDKILRVGGRLQNSNLSFNRQHPIIIPHGTHLAELLIHDAHIKTKHGGITLTMEYLQNNYWIVNAKRNIKRIIKKCVICFKFNAMETKQLMGSLPAARVQIARPFHNTGVDYAGPLEIKAWKGRCNKVYKGYIAIFICLCTKAIHIELVSDLSANAFIAAYRRFIARRGICKNLYSDCGTNFIGANNQMKAETKQIKKQWEEEIVNALNVLGTQWHFNPPASPHFGGLWEAGVKSIKFHLKRITGNARLTFEEYATLLSQIEACLNSRPLCPKTSDSNDLSTLTPGHFLIMSSLHTPPENDLINKKFSNLDRWKYIQQIYQNFWDKWSTEYLSRLQQRPKWSIQQDNIKIGDLVIIKDVRMPPTHWKLARVINTHPGDDKLIRVVTLKTATNVLQRPIHKLCLLPIADNHINHNKAMDDENTYRF